MTRGITVHSVVKNEDIWVWFALQSVLPFVEKILIFDTGSTDKTVEVIKSIQSPKIILEKRGPADPKKMAALRQEQIDRTKTEWILILDGDEIWPKVQLKKLLDASETAPQNTAALFNRTRISLGDLYHYLPESAGRYSIAGMTGNFNMRMVRKTPDLKVVGEYPLESFVNESGPLLKQEKNLSFVDCWYLHTSFLKRSSCDVKKKSGSFGRKKIWEKGLSLKEGELPEVLSQKPPLSLVDPFQKRGRFYETAALFTTPLINLKRVIR